MVEQRKTNLEMATQFRDASFSSYDEKSGTIDLIWTTGASVTRRGLDGYYEEVLSLDPSAIRLARLNSGAAPLLNTHADDDLDDVIGVVVEGSAKIVGGNGVAKVRLSTAPGDADAVEKIRSGIVKGVSVGYRIHRVEVVERNGQAPIYNVVDWEPLEISAVPVPADAGAMFRKRSISTTHPVEISELSYWSVPAVRARMLSAQRARGMADHHQAPAVRAPEPIIHHQADQWITFNK